jgi:methanogenic corrinoid protein MtbC1
MYTIKRAAELTGVSLPTLRAWERRYGVVSPERSSGRYRLYTEADLRALAIMASLVNDGWTASEAAAETLVRVSGEPGEPPAGGVAAPPRGLSELVAAAAALDSARVAAVLDAGMGRRPVERVADSWLMPTLAAIGDAWADGRVSVAGEHLVSYAVQRRLAAAYEGAAGRVAGPTVVLGLPPGARHELGVFAFAVVARRARLSTAYVGADVPLAGWEAAVTARRATAVVMAVPCRADVVPARQVAQRLVAAVPRLVVGVGGRFQEELGGAAIPLGHELVTGVAVLQAALSRRRS